MANGKHRIDAYATALGYVTQPLGPYTVEYYNPRGLSVYVEYDIRGRVIYARTGRAGINDQDKAGQVIEALKENMRTAPGRVIHEDPSD